MEKKKTGRKSLGLSESAKKERNKEQDKKRQSATRTVLMSIATHERWVELAERYGLTSRQLAVVLLDAVDDGKLHIDSSKLFESETAINRLSHQDTSEEPQPSDELDYQIYTLKEEISEDSWTAEDVANQIPEEKESVVEPESNNHLDNAKELEVEAIHQEVPPIDEECAHHTDKVHGDCIGDGEEMEPKPPAGYQILYVKEEQLDSDDTGDHDADANPGIMGQSLKEEAGDTIPESSDSVHHLDEHSTQAGFSEKRSLRNGKNTKHTVRYSMKIFEDYLRVKNRDINSINKLPNAGLDQILQKFYVGCRQKNGELYCRKSMLSIRFGLQRYFLNTKSVDINKHEDFANSKRVFKEFLAMLKKKGKGDIIHTQAVSQEDMAKIQDSLNLDDPQGLQDKVFIDVMLYFDIKGSEYMRDMTVDSFDTREERGKCYITLKDRKNSCKDKLEGRHSIMVSTNSPRCPVASFLRYKNKLNPYCKSFWQRPNPKMKHSSIDPWYTTAFQGKNTILYKMKNISARAGTKIYTNSSLRITSISTLQNGAYQDENSLSVTGHRPECSLNHCAQTSSKTNVNMASCATQCSASEFDLQSAPSSLTSTGVTTAAEQSESQELDQVNLMLDSISSNPDIMYILASGQADVLSQQVQASIPNIL